MEVQPDSQPDQEQLALESFFDYLKQDGEIPDVLDSSLWEINPYEDAYLISSKTRSNQAFLVQGDRVVEFAPAWKSIEQAYSEITAEQTDASTGFGDVISGIDIVKDISERHQLERVNLVKQFAQGYRKLLSSQRKELETIIDELECMIGEGKSEILFGEPSAYIKKLPTEQESRAAIAEVEEVLARNASTILVH